MRLLVVFLLGLMSVGCTTQSLGARCVQDQDCDTSVAVCRSELNVTEACTGSDCVCTLIQQPGTDGGQPATGDTGTGDAATNPG